MKKLGITHNGKGHGVYVVYVVAILILAIIGARSLYNSYENRKNLSYNL